MRCLMCGPARLGLLYDHVRDRFGMAHGEFRFLQCHECQSATLDTPPSSEAMAAAYPEGYTFTRTSGGRSMLRAVLAALKWRVFYAPAYRRRIATFRRLSGLRRGRLLEIGCGSGHLLVQFRDSGHEVEGVELSDADAAHGRERYGLPSVAGRVETVPLAPGRYDAIVLVNVLEHILDPPALARRAHELLRPGGCLVPSVPVVDSVWARLFGARWGAVTEAPRHVSIPSFRGVVALLRRAGFSEVTSAPAPLAERAADLVLSLLPSAAATVSYRGTSALAAVARRCVAAALMAPALLLAVLEQISWREPRRTEAMVFCGRKPGGA